MVFLRLLGWKGENQIAVAELEMCCGQYDSESLCFSLSPKGECILIHIHTQAHTLTPSDMMIKAAGESTSECK